jgi:predicted PurR-regulated permease PerM
MERLAIEISWASLWRILIFGVFVVALYLIREAILILLLSLVISTAFDPMVSWLERRRLPRILGTVIVFLAALTVVAFIIYALVPLALLELNSLFKNLSGFANQFLKIETPTVLLNVISPDLKALTNLLLSGGVPFLQVLGKLLGGITFVIAVLVISFYLTISRDGVERFLRAILPDVLELRAVDLYRRTRRKIGRWFQAQLVLSVVVGLLVFIGLWLLGVEQKLILALVAGLLELVPIVGPIFSGALATVVALSQSFTLALYVVLLFLVIQQAENHLLVPLIMKRAIGVHPVIVLVALLGGAKIAGVLGMLLAVPAAVFLQEVVEDWKAIKAYRRRGRLKINNAA